MADALNANVEAEMAVLGSMILSPAVIAEVRSLLKPEHFVREANRIVFRGILAAAEGSDAVDVVTIRDAIGARLAECGGAGYLIEVADYVPTPQNAGLYARIVFDLWTRRHLAAEARRLREYAEDPGRTPEEVRAFAAALGEVPGARPAAFVHLGAVKDGDGPAGVPTGFRSLDRAISTGGYPSGQVTMVRAYHKGGKSAFMTTSFVESLKAERRVLYATFADLNAPQFRRRVLRSLTGYGKRPLHDLEAGAEFDVWETNLASGWEGYVYDASELDSGDDVETFAAWFKAEHARKPFDLAFVDYAQEIRSSDRRAVSDLAEAGVVSHKLNRLAAQTKIPFVIGSQITEGRDGEKAKTKGGRVWEEKAGWVLTLQKEGTQATVEVSYSRFGPQGVSLPFRWDDAHIRFVEAA